MIEGSFVANICFEVSVFTPLKFSQGHLEGRLMSQSPTGFMDTSEKTSPNDEEQGDLMLT